MSSLSWLDAEQGVCYCNAAGLLSMVFELHRIVPDEVKLESRPGKVGEASSPEAFQKAGGACDEHFLERRR